MTVSGDRSERDAPTAASIVPAPALSEDDWKFLMGDDGTGHCRGCGQPIERIDPDCRVCMISLCAFMDEEPDYAALMEAARAA